MNKKGLINAIKHAGDDSSVLVRVYKTSPCVEPEFVFVDEDGDIQIILPEDSNIGK